MKFHINRNLKGLLLIISLIILCTIMTNYFVSRTPYTDSVTEDSIKTPLASNTNNNGSIEIVESEKADDINPISNAVSEESSTENDDAPLNPDTNLSYDKEQVEDDNLKVELPTKVVNDLIELIELDDSLVLDLRYATDNNFTGQVLYTEARCFIHINTAKKLIAANNELKSLGYSIKVFDAYRPHSVTELMWDLTDNKNYVANPKTGSNHNRGASVDITLVDSDGNELPMPSEFDEFTKRAHLNYNDSSKEELNNRELLGNIMVKHGFRRIRNEWWHFDDLDYKKYPILDISFSAFDK